MRFEPCRDASYGGVLCALPALLANGLLAKAQTLLGKVRGYYTLTHVLMLQGFMALARMRTVQKTGQKSPGEFGRLLGLDRSPEVRCLRRKLDELCAGNGAEKWAEALSRDWMQAEPEAVGTLYVDGHVRVYHGALTKLPRKYVTRERLCLRGTTDYWVNDARGRPFFVVERVVDIQASVGHASPAMTAHYTHVNETTARDVALALPVFAGNGTDTPKHLDALPTWAYELVEGLNGRNWETVRTALLKGGVS